MLKIKYSIVDIGSNTVRMNVYEINKEEKIFKMLFSEKETLGLINYVENEIMTEDGVKKLIQVLKNFKYCSESVNSENFICFATASLRNISNSTLIISSLNSILKTKIDLISGDEEAILDFYALKHFFEISNGLMVDIGGGSTEFLGFYDKSPIKAVSESIGSLSLYKKFISRIIPKKEEFEEIEKFLAKKLLDSSEWIKNYSDNIYLIGGTARAIAKIDMRFRNKTENVNGYKMTRKDVENQVECAKKEKKEYISAIIRETPDRIHTYTPGLIFCSKIVQFLNCNNINVCSCGIREGYVINRILNI